ncbi:MAG TPA: CDP-diacylglycerol--glycerol-3-phosphate 3-phosphatidyltransferase [Cyanobacteria bacterium UBA8803]|nr:CDP-diacylglycerol--glycerol-3-phosphate 3-phosphatidyltransferase [Cyanobacteria bacterium UBA9273]HBL62476.1 CDP-diacylglycerol--glycerol-3-phosphate 3-phosphatidyltransferase [Cyanobacteria bacterium UBA8803]
MSNTTQIKLKHQSFSLIFQYIPIALVVLRFAIAPLLLLDALNGQINIWFIIGFVAAFLSDIFDGVIARRLGVSTPALRKADSWADICLYLCIAAAAWIVHPDIIAAFHLPLLMVVWVQGLWWIINLVKYGQPASYHTYSAKFWGLTLFVATLALFGFDYGGVTLSLAITVGIIHTLEEIGMTFILPNWTHDVLSIAHALELRHHPR